MAGQVRLAIILTATMRGAHEFDRAQGGIRGIGAAIKAIQPMLVMFAAQAAFRFLKDSIDTTIQFQQTMAKAGSIIGKTADEMKGFGDEARAMSQEIPKSPADLGTALYDIFSAGVTDSADAMDALRLSAMAASAGLTETATAAKAGIATMNAFGMEATDLSHIFDVQFLTIKYGIIRYEELAGVIGQLAPSANTAGQSLEDMFAAMAILTKQGLEARMAATSLARAMEAITRPPAIRAAEELGISFVEMSMDARKARDEFLLQTAELNRLSDAYKRLEGDVSDLGHEMSKVSLDQQKNRLEIAKIRREAEKQGRSMNELTAEETRRIKELESANADLSIQYDEMNVGQSEMRIEMVELNEEISNQQELAEGAGQHFDELAAASGKFRPLVEIIADISEKYGHLGEAAQADIIAQMFPEQRARRAIMAIMGNTEELMDISQEMTEGAGAMGDAYAINTETAAASAQLMENAMEDLKIEIGTALMPVMMQFFEVIKEDLVPMIENSFIPILESLVPILKVMFEVVGFLAGIFADYPELLYAIVAAVIAWKVAQIALNVAMWANPIGIIIGAIALLALGIYWLIKNIDEVVEAWTWLGGELVKIYERYIKPIFDGIMALIQPIIDAVKYLVEALGKVAGVGEGLRGVGRGIRGVVGLAEGGIVTSPTLAVVGEAGAEAVIPLKNGKVPIEGGGQNIETHDTYNITINTGQLSETETPESLQQKIIDAMIEAKMRGVDGR